MSGKILLAPLISVLSFASTVYPQANLKYNEVYDFGHIGIDFLVFHSFKIYNTGDQPVKITNVYSTCDCTSLTKTDSVIFPDDSVAFNIAFETTNYYGLTTKSIKVITDNPNIPEIEFFYNSIIGQWLSDIKPDPISLFFLPLHKSKKIVIPNLSKHNIELTKLEKSHDYFDVHILEKDASTGDKLEIEVIPKTNLKQGTYKSSLTLTIATPGSASKKTTLTIPVKIVRY